LDLIDNPAIASRDIAYFLPENSIKTCKMELCTPESFNFQRKKAFSCLGQEQRVK